MNTDKLAFDPRKRPKQPLTDDAKREILDGMASGLTLYRLLWANPHLPNYEQVQQLRRDDPKFAEQFEIARENGQEARLEEALDHQYSVRENRELSVAAAKYLESSVRIAEKLAPKRFGQLIRHAGHDGEALTVQVVSYKDGGTLEAEAIPALIPSQDVTKPEIAGE